MTGSDEVVLSAWFMAGFRGGEGRGNPLCGEGGAPARRLAGTLGVEVQVVAVSGRSGRVGGDEVLAGWQR